MFEFSSVFKTFSVVFQVMLGIFGASESPQVPNSFFPDGLDCREPAWVKKPRLKTGDVYLASMNTDCIVYPELGGNLEKLQAFSIEQIRSQAQINRGPIDTQFESLPSKYLDVTAVIRGKNDTVTIQQDVNIATDNANRLISSTVSRKINGSGNGAYLKKLDTRIEVTKTAVKTEDRITITFYTEVQKPWFAPEGMFLSELEKRVPGEFSKLRDKVVTEISKNY